MEKLARAFSKRFLVFVAVAAVAACSAASPIATSATSGSDIGFNIEVPTDSIAEGGIFVASIEAPGDIGEATGLFQGHVVQFFPDGEPSPKGGFRKYSALLGVEYGTTPGSVELNVKAKIEGELSERRATIAVKAGVFPSERLRVPPKTISPSKKDQKQIVRDRAALARAYATKTLSRFWDPPAVMPVERGISSVFGTARVYNGHKHNVHLGTDLRAPAGTPIMTPLSGQIVIARYLFYTGYTVIIDHGYGLFTIYGHMSQLKVKEGATIKKGQVMGLSGMTGRSSGPHLHWGVNLHGTKVDPMLLINALHEKQGKD